VVAESRQLAGGGERSRHGVLTIVHSADVSVSYWWVWA